MINDKKLWVAFKLLDNNNDDHISANELMQRFTRSDIDGLTELKVDESFWRELIRACDTNNDGYISWEEFRSNMYKILTLLTEVDLQAKYDEEEKAQAATLEVG